jgi:choline/glycine/proline betaine transport protein
MGIGLLFWSISEPIYHFLSPPMAEGGTAEAAKEAMKFTFLGFSCLGSVCIGRFIFGLHVFSRTSLTIRSIYPFFLGDKIYSGDAMNIILLFLLLYLVWLLLWLGVQQIAAGLESI